jgi:tetratricopeptide (TPR) repeat protein
MRVEHRITALWRTLSDKSRRGAILRRRLMAMGGMAMFMLALLAAIGFLWLVLEVLAVVALGLNLVAGGMLLRRYVPRLACRRDVVRAGALELGRFATRAGAGTRRAGLVAASRVAVAADKAAHELRTTTSNVRAARAPREGWPLRTAPDPNRDALRANAAGSQLRRAGAYAEAAEQHCIALELYRAAGDRRAEALTLNNLALALDRAGDPAAFSLFEEAATILGELGEEQQEGQVIANLALAFRRRGREEQSGEVLDLALEKLHPDSQEYRKLEELRRAS